MIILKCYRLPYLEPVDRELFAIEKAKGKRVLHIGCTGGDLNQDPSISIQARLENVSSYCIGIDILEPQIERYQEAGLNVILGDAESFDLNDHFDLIFAGEVIEHLSNPGLFLRCANAHLIDDGELIITTPQPWTIPRLVLAFFRKYQILHSGHVSWYDPDLLENLLRRYGLEMRELHPSRIDYLWVHKVLNPIFGSLFYSDFIAVCSKLDDFTDESSKRQTMESQITIK